MKIIVVSQDRPLQNEAEAITRILDSGAVLRHLPQAAWLHTSKGDAA